jgi:hypothetical protein
MDGWTQYPARTRRLRRIIQEDYWTLKVSTHSLSWTDMFARIADLVSNDAPSGSDYRCDSSVIVARAVCERSLN